MLDQVPLPDVRQYEEEFHRFMDTRFASLLAGIREKKNLDDDLKKSLTAAITEFNEQFVASRAAAARG
jgi:F-type H+-transporting ATPase subunit alpha